MSLVADIIACTKNDGPHNDVSLLEMQKLFEKSEEARVSVCQSLNSHYVTLSASFNDTINFQEKIKKCLKDIDTLESQVKDEIIPSIEGSASEIGRVTIRWKEVKAELHATELLLEVHTLLDRSHSALLSNDFISAVDNLNKVNDLLVEASEEKVESQLDILSSLRDDLVLKRTELVSKVAEVWNKFISFNEEELNDGTKVVNLSIHELDSKETKVDIEATKQMFAALNTLGELQRYIRLFGKNLVQHFIKPILCECRDLEVCRTDSGDSVMYTRSSSNPTKVKDTDSAMKALERLEMVFTFLNGHFSKYSLQEEANQISLISLLGSEIGDEFIQLVLNSCLEESVPCDRKNLKAFNDVQTRVEEFHNFLVNIGFYGEDHQALISYVANVETVYGNKTCASILMRARNLMVKALHVTATIAPLEPEGPLVATNKSGKELKETTLRLKNLSTATFKLPKCEISVSVCELVNLIYETLEEACVSVPEFAVRLFHTVRNIMSMYCHVIPTAHAHTLATTPEHAALVHNNSLFVSHHALLLGHHYKNRFPESLRDMSLTTVDLGYLIRNSGCEVFLKAMQGHKNTLLQTLKEGLESSSLESDSSSVTSLHSSVKECLKELQRLRVAWQPVLPRSVYVKSIGTLCGSVVEELVLRIIALEEISADDAIGLINVLSLLTSNVPPLFLEAKDEGKVKDEMGYAATEVRLWDKMKELIVVLGASLRDLSERWAEGKGPLAHHFPPAEVKHLIKAIFQNTDRRAQLLAKIK